MGKWQTFNLSNMIPPEATQAVSSVTGAVDTFLDAYRQALQIAKAYQASLGGGNVDVLGVLIQAVVDLVEGLLQAGKIHVLFVPIAKHYPTDNNIAVPLSLDDIALELGFDLEQAGVTFSSGANQAYTALAGQTGGNKSFYTTFLQALNDPFDVNRPQYNQPNDAVAMSVMMLGAPSFSALVDVAAAFNRVFRPSANSDLAARMVPSPQGLRVRIVGVPAGTTIGARLDWTPPKTTFDSPYFPGVFMRVAKYAVIRSTNLAAASAASVLDFFSTQELTKGLTSDDEAKSSIVTVVGSGGNSSWVDTDELDATKPYFYCVAWQVEVLENGAVKTLPFDIVSNVVKTRVNALSPTQASAPPDWEARGSALDLLPDLATQVQLVLAQIKVLGDRNTGGAAASISAGLSLVEKNIDAFATRIDELNAQVKRLTAVFGAPIPGFYTTSFAGTGGNPYLVGELAARLNDKSDSSRPPYDGNEYVMGVCIVAGGPRLPDIQPVIDFLNALLTPDAENPLLNALNAIDNVVTAEEVRVFGPNLQPMPVHTDNGVPVVTYPDGTVVPASEVDPLTGLPKAPSNPVIADDGTPVVTDDPSNPNAGDTNEKTPEDLC